MTYTPDPSAETYYTCTSCPFGTASYSKAMGHEADNGHEVEEEDL
jgi:hypothetical protein